MSGQMMSAASTTSIGISMIMTSFMTDRNRTFATAHAIIGIVSLAFGLVTPPYGLCLMISCAVAKVPVRFVLKDTMIMLIPMLLTLAAIIIWPEIPLILPKLVAPELLK